jgi:hypothetical protein
MANVLGNYNETFFAQEALTWLRSNLGFAGRVFRGMEEERNVRQIGDTIKMRRPRTFVTETHVQGTGSGTAQDLHGQDVQLVLDQHEEVKFSITDRELAFTQSRIIEEHIGPAANAVAEAIDQSLYDLHPLVGPRTPLTAAQSTTEATRAAKNYFTKARRTMVENKAPRDPGMWHYLADPEAAEIFLGDPIFHAADTVGGSGNQEALMRGSLGNRFGYETFESQLADAAVAAVVSTVDTGGDVAGAIDGAASPVPLGTASIIVDALTDTQTLTPGQSTFTIAGDATVYSITTVSGAVTTNAITLGISPGLQFETADNAVVTFRTVQADPEEAAMIQNLAFHRNAFGLAMAPLPTIGDGAGARISTAVDPESGLAVRARVFYEGNSSVLSVALDALWGVTVLNGQLATRVIRPA